MTLPYGILSTRLFEHVRVAHPHAFLDDLYLVDHMMITFSKKRVFRIMPNEKDLVSQLQLLMNHLNHHLPLRIKRKKMIPPQVVSTTKLPILNPNEFDLWKMRIEQYFLMTDYSLWEVILNGDSPAPTRVIEGVLQPVSPTTVEQRLPRKNELKARGTLLMALPDKHQLKFNTHKDAKTLMKAIKKRFRGNTETKKVQKTLLKQQYKNFTGSSSKSLDQIHDRLQKFISQLEILRRNKTDLEEQSLDDLFNSLKIHEAEVKISSSIDADNLEEIDLKWQMALLIVECYNCHRKGHFARECRSPKDTRRNGTAEPQRRNVPVETSTSNALVSQCDGMGRYDWSFQADDEPTNYTLMAFAYSSSSSDNENLSDLLASQTNTKTGLGYNSQVFTHAMFDCDDYCTSKSDASLPPSLIYDKYQSGNGYHAVPPPYTGTFMPPKPDLVFHNAPNDVKTVHTAFNVELSPTKPDNDLPSVHHVETSIPTANPKTAIPKPTSNGNRRNRKACFMCKSLDHLIKDYGYYEKKLAQTTARNHAPRGHPKYYASMPLLNPQRHVVPTTVVPKSKLVLINAARPITAVVPKIKVTRPRQEKPIVTKLNLPPRRHINRIPSPKASTFPPKVTAFKVSQGNPQHALKDNGVIDSGCSRHMTGNMSYMSDFEELNGGYVAFGGNLKGGKISRKGKIKTRELDFDDVYFVKELQFNLFSVSQMCDKKNSVLFTDTECLVLSPEFKLPDENQVLLRNIDRDAAFDEKEPEFEGREPESEVNVPSKFEDFFDNSINKDNAAGTLVSAVGKLSPNSTNTFSAAGPSNAAATLTHRKSSYVDSSQLLDDLNMPELEDITYSEDEDDVGTEVDFNNLETSITEELLQYKMQKVWVLVDLPHGKRAIGHTQEEGIDYEEVFAPVARIEAIRLFLAYASFMGFMMYQMDVKSAFLYGTIEEEVYVCQPLGFEDPDYPDKVYEVVKALYGLHQALRAWYETLANYLLENGFQRGNIDQTLFIKRQKDGKLASTPIDTEKPLLKDPDGEDVDVHTYRSMIGSLMYLTSSRPDIMFEQCKKQTVVATSSTEAKYVDAASCCVKVLWIQNQRLDKVQLNAVKRYILLECVFLGFGLTMQVALSSIKSLKRMLHVSNILSAGSLTTPQMVLNSPCLIHIKNWLV
nr:putative ribonuclease H-like domain-containing protein [Tanacetum cinerariifolium]